MELADAKTQVSDGEKELDAAKDKVADGEKELADAKHSLQMDRIRSIRRSSRFQMVRLLSQRIIQN